MNTPKWLKQAAGEEGQEGPPEIQHEDENIELASLLFRELNQSVLAEFYRAYMGQDFGYLIALSAKWAEEIEFRVPEAVDDKWFAVVGARVAGMVRQELEAGSMSLPDAPLPDEEEPNPLDVKVLEPHKQRQMVDRLLEQYLTVTDPAEKKRLEHRMRELSASLLRIAMLVVCAWCGKSLGKKEPLDDPRTSHGMCEDCVKKADDDIK